MYPFWAQGYRIYLPAIFALIGLAATGLFFMYKFHPKWNKKIPIMVVYVLLLGGEIAKQVLTFINKDWFALPFSLCATALYFLPFLIFLKKDRLLKRLMWCFNYILCIVVAGIMLTVPSALFMVRPNGSFDSYNNCWGLIYHSLLMFIGIWFILWHPVKISWKDFMWTAIIFILLMLLGVGITALVYYTSGVNLNIMALWSGSFLDGLSPQLHVPIMISIYTAVFCLGFLLVKLIILKYINLL